MATIQGVYVALFGRPADPAGLAYFNSVTNNGADLSKIGDLAATKEYTDRFAGQSNVQIINSIYQSLFNRDAESAGLNFFVDALNKGTLNIKNIAIAILDGAQGTDKTIATNKITAADNFTKALDTPVEIGAYTGNNAAAQGRAFLAPVGAAPSSIPTAAQTDAATAALVSASTGGVSITTDGTAAEAVSTTATDTKFKSTGGDDTITATAVDSTNTKIDGGFGVDTVKATVGANWTPAAGNVTNIEKLFLTSTGAFAVNLTNVSGLKEVWDDGSAASTTNVTNINSGATIGVKGTVDTPSFGFKEAQTGTTSVALNKADIGTSLTITNGADTVALSTTGGSTVTGFTDTTLKTLTITGSGDLSLATAAGTEPTKLDASALAGKLTLDVSNTTKAITITGTNNADEIKLAAGAYKDVLVYNKAEASTYATFEQVTDFATADDKIDLKAFALTKVAGITLLNNLVDGASYGANSVAQYSDGTDMFVFVDSNGDGKINLASDVAVKLMGHATADLTIANFVLA